ncbi:MAG TPA: response regulator [Bryobacteraceae bacterium]|nr:response regulator [Bryobacteraceae bacterium]
MSTTESNTILVVDDDPAVRRLTAAILESSGYNVIEAECGRQGLERFAEHHQTVELVLSDVVMPRMSGIEMIGRILALDPSMPVLLMTGWSGGDKPPDAVPVLAKPFTPSRLLQAITSCLSSHTPALHAA